MTISQRRVDKVIPEKNWNQKIHDIKKYHVDTFTMGSDWTGKFDYLKPYCNVIYLPRTKGISTSKIKHDLGLANTNTWKVNPVASK